MLGPVSGLSGPYLGPNCLQMLSAEDKRYHQQTLLNWQDLLFSGARSIFSSPEPLAHGELLRSLDCVVCSRQLLQKTSAPELLAGFLPNLAGMILIWPSFIIIQMVHCISRSHRLKVVSR